MRRVGQIPCEWAWPTQPWVSPYFFAIHIHVDVKCLIFLIKHFCLRLLTNFTDYCINCYKHHWETKTNILNDFSPFKKLIRLQLVLGNKKERERDSWVLIFFKRLKKYNFFHLGFYFPPYQAACRVEITSSEM